ncbi:hypothetical protein CEXT_401241 [Caerostris extrusa]|uniref:Uncharacterized protein n=1 Tax=Caerostris extrusa TaxID=172846 RepID=A0AAV4VQC2_CAEEX|nr:hypothetical protein CEXT_401241 [Caerostris extrusa]
MARGSKNKIKKEPLTNRTTDNHSVQLGTLFLRHSAFTERSQKQITNYLKVVEEENSFDFSTGSHLKMLLGFSHFLWFKSIGKVIVISQSNN